MSRLVHEGNTKIFWLTTIAASDLEPTAAEITAGTDITAFVTKDGLSTPQNQNMVDSATLNEVFDAQRVGSWGGSLQLTMFRDDTTETGGWDLVVYGTEGYIVVSRFGAPVATDVVEVYPAEMHNPVMAPTAANEMQRFTATLAVTAEPNLRAVVAA